MSRNQESSEYDEDENAEQELDSAPSNLLEIYNRELPLYKNMNRIEKDDIMENFFKKESCFFFEFKKLDVKTIDSVLNTCEESAKKGELLIFSPQFLVTATK